MHSGTLVSRRHSGKGLGGLKCEILGKTDMHVHILLQEPFSKGNQGDQISSRFRFTGYPIILELSSIFYCPNPVSRFVVPKIAFRTLGKTLQNLGTATMVGKG